MGLRWGLPQNVSLYTPTMARLLPTRVPWKGLEIFGKNHPVGFSALLVLVFWGFLFYALAVVKYGGDGRGFFRLGSQFYHPPVMRDIPRDSPWGYDGQFYAALATDPFLQKPQTRQALDTPHYRAQRLLLPALAWLLALGDAHTALWWYLALVWVLGLGSVLLVVWFLAKDGAPVFWAVPLVITAGLVVSLTRGTPDAAAVTWVLAALLACQWRRWGWGAAFLATCVLTRETSVLLVPPVFLWQWREGQWRRACALVAPALVAFFAWQLSLHLRFGSLFSKAELANFGLPMGWLPWKLREVFAPADINGVEVLGLLALLVTVASLPAAVASKLGLWELAYLFFGLLALVLGPSVITEAYAYSRVLMVLPFVAVVLVTRVQRSWQKALLFAVPLLWALLGLALIRGETLAHGGVGQVLKILS